MSSDQRRYRGVLEKMLHLLDCGEYPVGGRLPPERELAERFAVSRPTIREAIVALETLNRVQVRIGSGIYVLPSTPRAGGNAIDPSISAFELTEARALIEGEAAALAAKMITDDELASLERTLAAMADETEDGKLVSELADKEFHHIISQATRNAMVTAVIDNLWHVRDNSPDIHRAYQAICETDYTARLDEHTGILAALRNHDPVAARAAMHEHFARILSKLIAIKEEEELQEVRRQALESRERFLAHEHFSHTNSSRSQLAQGS